MWIAALLLGIAFFLRGGPGPPQEPLPIRTNATPVELSPTPTAIPFVPVGRIAEWDWRDPATGRCHPALYLWVDLACEPRPDAWSMR